ARTSAPNFWSSTESALAWCRARPTRTRQPARGLVDVGFTAVAARLRPARTQLPGWHLRPGEAAYHQPARPILGDRARQLPPARPAIRLGPPPLPAGTRVRRALRRMLR